MMEKYVLVIVVLSILTVVPMSTANESEFRWEVEVGDKFDFRLQYVVCNRSLSPDQRVMQLDEKVYMEITGLLNISEDLPGPYPRNYIWVPIYTLPSCRNDLAFPNGTSLYETSHRFAVRMNVPFMAAMPVGNWTGANEAVQMENDTQHDGRLSYEALETATSWGFIYRDSAINMTDTRVWSKSDGSLLTVDIRNGITEFFPSTEQAVDLVLERVETSYMAEIIIVAGSLLAVTLMVGVMVWIRKRQAG